MRVVLLSIVMAFTYVILYASPIHHKFTYMDQLEATRIILQVARQEGVNGRLLVSICMKESSLDRWAGSTDGKSFGLCQITRIAMEDNGYFGSIKQLYDPEVNIKIAALVLKKCFREFDSLDFSLACYNRGSRGLREYVQYYSYGSVEDLDYVIKVKRYIESRFIKRLIELT